MRLTIEEIDEIWQSLSIGEDEIDMHEYAEAIEAAVLAKIASGQEPVAWQTFDGEGGYEFRQFAENETYHDDYIKRNGEKYSTWVTPLYAHSAPAQQPLSDAQIAKACMHLMCVHPNAKTTLDIARAIEAAVLTKLADKLQDAERLEWLTEYAYVETCFTARGGVAEIAGTDREVPPPGKSRLYTVKDAIDAAILASKAEKP
jgi:hypothetical protein